MGVGAHDGHERDTSDKKEKKCCAPPPPPRSFCTLDNPPCRSPMPRAGPAFKILSIESSKEWHLLALKMYLLSL